MSTRTGKEPERGSEEGSEGKQGGGTEALLPPHLISGRGDHSVVFNEAIVGSIGNSGSAAAACHLLLHLLLILFASDSVLTLAAAGRELVAEDPTLLRCVTHDPADAAYDDIVAGCTLHLLEVKRDVADVLVLLYATEVSH